MTPTKPDTALIHKIIKTAATHTRPLILGLPKTDQHDAWLRAIYNALSPIAPSITRLDIVKSVPHAPRHREKDPTGGFA